MTDTEHPLVRITSGSGFGSATSGLANECIDTLHKPHRKVAPAQYTICCSNKEPAIAKTLMGGVTVSWEPAGGHKWRRPN